MDKIDNLIIGGGMSYTFAKATGGRVGSSLLEKDKLETATNIIAAAKKKGVNLFLPVDSLNGDEFSNGANTNLSDINEIENGWMGLDIGPKTCKNFIAVINQSKTILWNGPMGVFEMDNFENGTRTVAEAVAHATSKGAYSLVGGGDSVAAINKFNLADKVSYVSTGGGGP